MVRGGVESTASVPVRGMHVRDFSEVYCDRVYFLCAERFVTGSGFQPHGTEDIYYANLSRGSSQIREFSRSAEIHNVTRPN